MTRAGQGEGTFRLVNRWMTLQYWPQVSAAQFGKAVDQGPLIGSQARADSSKVSTMARHLAIL